MSDMTSSRFWRVSSALLPLCGLAALLFLGAGLWLAFHVPPEARQGETVRILFVHVPAAWTAMLAFLVLTAASLFVLAGKDAADVVAASIPPLGAVFTALGLMTGSLWGRPMWGTWWEWDGRLTSFLLLLLIYLGLIALRGSLTNVGRAAKASALLALVGAIDLPVIFFSVQWWSSLHQGSSILRKGGASMAPVYLYPLFLMALGYSFLFLCLLLVRVRTQWLIRRCNAVADTGRDEMGLEVSDA